MFALLDHLGIETFKGVGVSAGGNVLLHMGTIQPERVSAMALVSATSYFPAQARPIMRQYPELLRPEDRELLRRRNPGGNAQIETILASTKAFAYSYDDMNFTPPYLATITARMTGWGARSMKRREISHIRRPTSCRSKRQEKIGLLRSK